MNKIKAIEIFRKIFNVLSNGGIFMLSIWTNNYSKMPIGTQGEPGVRPGHKFDRIPTTEDLQIIIGGERADWRIGEIRRFYNGHEELIEEFKCSDENNRMDIEGLKKEYYEKNAILRVWIRKK